MDPTERDHHQFGASFCGRGRGERPGMLGREARRDSNDRINDPQMAAMIAVALDIAKGQWGESLESGTEQREWVGCSRH